jgi:hypothetical protein
MAVSLAGDALFLLLAYVLSSSFFHFSPSPSTHNKVPVVLHELQSNILGEKGRKEKEKEACQLMG